MDEKRELEASSLIVDEESNEHADTMPLDHHNQKKNVSWVQTSRFKVFGAV